MIPGCYTFFIGKMRTDVKFSGEKFAAVGGFVSASQRLILVQS